MSIRDDNWIFDDLPEPGVFSGIMTLLGGLLGLFLAVYAYMNGLASGAVMNTHIAFIVGLGILFAFLCSAFWFLVGWLVETAWPLFLLMAIIGVLGAVSVYFYFGADGYHQSFSQALMWG